MFLFFVYISEAGAQCCFRLFICFEIFVVAFSTPMVSLVYLYICDQTGLLDKLCSTSVRTLFFFSRVKSNIYLNLEL